MFAVHFIEQMYLTTPAFSIVNKKNISEYNK